MHSLRGLVISWIGLEPVQDVNAPDHQDLLLCLDFAAHVGSQVAFTGRDTTRFQRASKGPGQSTAG